MPAAKSKRKSRSKTHRTDGTANGECFVIMPFGGWFDDYYETVYQPAIESAGLAPKRADDIYRPGTIVNDIWSYTKSARIILADLSGKNPNVFYELGLAHALEKPVVLVSSNQEDVPFDLRHIRVILYDQGDPFWGQKLVDKLADNIQSALADPEDAIFRVDEV